MNPQQRAALKAKVAEQNKAKLVSPGIEPKENGQDMSLPFSAPNLPAVMVTVKEKPHARPHEAPPKPLPSPSEGTPKPKKTDPGPLLTFTCGHKEPQSKYTSKKCGKCRQELSEKTAKLNREARKAAQANRKPKYHEDGRLPDGSSFAVKFNAEDQEWNGHLMIDGGIFTDSSSGVFRLLQKLDMQYRDWLAAQAEPAKDGAP